MNHIFRLLERYFNVANSQLCCSGVPINTIVASSGTPLFIYDCTVLDQKWACLRSTFPPEFAVSYSVKANPNPALLRYFLAQGCGLEIASGGEFALALHAGCPPEKVIFAGPAKTEGELEFVLAHGIGAIHIESLLEAQRIRAISRRLRIPARVALRVNPGGAVQGGAMRMGGRQAPFGVDEERLDLVLDDLLSCPALTFSGIHLFTGTQILDYTILMDQYRKGVEVARRVAGRLGRPLQTLDFGGGLGIPYFAHEQELDMAKLHAELVALVAELQGEACFAGTQLPIEPGRYLVGEAGIYVTRIVDIKTSRGKKYLIVDGGMHHHLAASGNLGQVIKRNFPVALLNKLHEEPMEAVDVVGSLCTPLDVLARDILLPQAEVNDVVGVFQSGAYARTASPLGFLSHPTPAEVLAHDGQVTLIRRRGTYDDLWHDIPR
jgi:diaminopimelate decarboxylase